MSEDTIDLSFSQRDINTVRAMLLIAQGMAVFAGDRARAEEMERLLGKVEEEMKWRAW